ncbi:translocation/assembly module TamB domain-containing protein [bacterium]
MSNKVSILLRIGFTMGVICLLIYGIILLPGVQNQIRILILQELGDTLPGYISIESIRMDGRFRIQVHGIQWADSSSGKDPTLSCETLMMQVNLFHLIRKEFPFTLVSATKPVIDLRILNLFLPDSSLTQHADQKSSSPLKFNNCLFQISEGVIISSNSKPFIQGQIKEINGWLQLSQHKPFIGFLSIGDLSVKHDSSALSIGQLICSVSEEDNSQRGTIELIHEKTHFNAQLSFNKNRYIEGQWQFRDDGHVLPYFFDSKYSDINQCSGSGQFQGQIDSLYSQSAIYLMDNSTLTPDSMTLSFRVLSHQIRDIFIHIPWLDGNVTFSGDLGLDSSIVSAWSFKVESLSLNPLWHGVQRMESPFEGYIHGELSAIGPGLDFRQWTGSGWLDLKDITYDRDPVAPLRSYLKFSPDSIQLFAKQGITDVSGRFLITSSGPRGVLRMKNIRTGLLAPWVNLSGLQGRMHGQVNIGGGWEKPTGQFRVNGDHLTYQFMVIDTISMGGIYENSQFEFQKSTFYAHSEPSVDSLESKEPFNGDLKIRANLSGPIHDLKGHLNMRGRIYEWSGFHADTLSLQSNIEHGNLSSTALIMKDSSKIKIKGQLGLTTMEGWMETYVSHLDDSTWGVVTAKIDTLQGLRFQTGNSGLPLNVLPAFHQSIPALRGRLTLQGNYNPFSEDPMGLLHFQGSGLPLAENETGVVNGRLDFYDKKIDINASVSCAEDSLRFDGKIWQTDAFYFETNSSIEARLQGHVQNIAPYIQLWAPHISLNGVLTTDLEISGLFNDLSLFGEIGFYDGQFDLNQHARFAKSIELTTRFQGDSLQMNISGIIGDQDFSLQGKAFNFLKSSPTWQIYWQSELSQLVYLGRMSENGWEGSFKAANFSLQHLQPVLPSLDKLDGQLNAKFSFQPNVNGLLEAGYLDIQNFSFSVSEPPIEFSEGQLRIGLDAQTIRLDSLSVQVNDGFYHAAGEYTHQGFQHFAGKSRLIGGHSQFKKIQNYQIVIDSIDVTLTSNDMKHQLSGQLTFGESKFKQSIRLNDVLTWMDRTKQPWKRPSDFQKNVQLNIRIRNSKPFWIDNNLARLKINSGLAVYGSIASPYFMGNLSVKEGYVLYLDRKFEVKQGEMIFTNPESPYPEIAFFGQKSFKSFETFNKTQYTISLNLSGPANRLRTQWRSEPSLAEVDILSLLTLGATRRELTKEDSERWGTQLTDVLQDRLALISSQRVSMYTTKTLGNMFGLEQVAVEGNLFKFGKSWGPQLLASKKLSDRLLLTYRSSVGQSNAQ